MYFAILGKNPEISKVELQLIQPKNISSPKKGILVFDTDFAEKISTLGGIIKAGSVVKEKDLPEVLKDVKIIWIKEIANGKHLKQTIGIKRFKTVDFFHTDKEIKEKWLELINLGNGNYGVVEQYQNIPLYETIDFEKPARSMQMGMMPAKLTHMMINIWLHCLPPLLKEGDHVSGRGFRRIIIETLQLNEPLYNSNDEVPLFRKNELHPAVIDISLKPEGKKAMDRKEFLNGYLREKSTFWKM